MIRPSCASSTKIIQSKRRLDGSPRAGRFSTAAAVTLMIGPPSAQVCLDPAVVVRLAEPVQLLLIHRRVNGPSSPSSA